MIAAVRSALDYLIAREDESHDAYFETIARGILGPDAETMLRSLGEACAARAHAYRVARALFEVASDEPGPMSLAASLHVQGTPLHSKQEV